MAQVAVLIRIFPDEQEKVDELIAKIKQELRPVQIGKEELAFGALAIKALFYAEEKDGSTPLEEKLQGFPNVSSIDVVAVDRLG
ncbi:MAG: elongation factor 1-beta [Candidatus Micrarchaeia archaeon]